MENKAWYDIFMGTLSAKYPKKSALAQALVELLNIEREAAYRRLRGEVIFSIYEIVKISSAWNISLDNIGNNSMGKISFLMQPINYIAPSEQESQLLQHIIHSIDGLKDFPDTEFMDVCNKLPRQLLAGFGYLNQFHLFKWIYQYGNEKKPVSFSEAAISEEKSRLTADYYRAIKNVPNTSFIFDPMIFDNLACEIRYFHSIKMISYEEKELIKKDLYDLLDYLLEVANYGCYPETHNKVNLYISRLSVNTNYSYTHTHQVSICFVHVFDKYEIYSYNTDMVEKFKTWMQSKKSSSIQISEVDKQSRIEFFTKQRQIVDGL